MAAKQVYGAELSKYLDKWLDIRLNGNWNVAGVLKGFDSFMNVVLDNAVEHDGIDLEKSRKLGIVFIRGNSILLWKCLDKIS